MSDMGTAPFCVPGPTGPTVTDGTLPLESFTAMMKPSGVSAKPRDLRPRAASGVHRKQSRVARSEADGQEATDPTSRS